MKIDGHLTGLFKSLHVPDLDCDLVSCTRHGTSGEEYTYFLGNIKTHLIFPTFDITTDIPEDGDLPLLFKPLTDDNLGIPNFMCDRIPFQDNHLDSLETRLYLNNVLKGHSTGKV